MTQPEEPYVGFELVAALRAETAALIRRHAQVVRHMGAKAARTRWQRKLEELAELVDRDTFKVLIVGQFSRGKSTLINALLGQKILPSHATATTAIINEIKYGPIPKAVVYQRYRPGEEPSDPIEVAVDQLENFVKINEEDDESGRPSTYARADIFWPIDLCRNGVELIDTPGLDELNMAREEETISYLPKVDAVVMVLDAGQPATRSELRFFQDTVQPLGHDDAFWVVNKFDHVDAEERVDVQNTVRKSLKNLARAEGRIFFVSARGALEAKISGNVAALNLSGLPPLEASLQRFLTWHRGRSKVVVPIRQLQQSIREVRDSIRDEEMLLAKGLTELSEKAALAKEPLSALEQLARRLADYFERRLENLANEVTGETREYLQALIYRIPELVDEISPDVQISLSPRGFQVSLKRFVGQLAVKLRSSIQQDVAQWHKERLSPFIARGLEEIMRAIGDDVRGFESDVRDLRLNLLSIPEGAPSEGFVVSVDDLPTFRFGTTVGTIAGGRMAAGAAVIGAGIAFGVLATLAPIAFAVVFAIYAALWATAGIISLRAQLSKVKTKVQGRIRERIAAAAAEQLQAQVPGLIDQIRDATGQQFSELANDFRTGLNSQVDGLREDLELALAARTKGENRVTERRNQITAQLEELRQIEEALDVVVDRVLALDGDRS